MMKNTNPKNLEEVKKKNKMKQMKLMNYIYLQYEKLQQEYFAELIELPFFNKKSL